MTCENKDCDCRFFDEGDWVECKLDTSIFGIIVGETDWGHVYKVQISSSREIVSFYGATLRHMERDEYEPDPTKGVKSTDGNVISVNFKNEPLTKKTPTQGAA